MDREAAETAALRNFLGQLTKLDAHLNSQSQAAALYAAIDVADTAFLIRTLFRQGARAVLLKRGAGTPESLEERVELIARANRDSAKPLKELIDLVSRAIQPGGDLFHPPLPPLPSKKTVFIVHGHRLGLVRSVTSALLVFGPRIEIKVLSREVNKGRTLIEKFDETAQRAQFAIVIATGDDVGRAVRRNTKRRRPGLEKRARQNVIFEWGYFVGRITRRSVALLYEEGVKLPSDLDGTVHIALDARQEWKRKLVEEVRVSLFA